jgi:hypothetical protein
MGSYVRVLISGLAAAAVFATAFAGCSNEKNGLTEEEFLFAAQAAANASLLEIDDVPADGWRSEPDEPADPGDDRESGLTGECAELEENEDLDGWPGQTAFANGDALIGPTHEINTDASVFRDEDDAVRVVRRYFELFERCRDEILIFARSDPEMGPDDTLDFSLIEGPDLGDETHVTRLEITADGSRLVVDFLTIRQGRIIVSFIWGGGFSEDTDRNIYASIYADKVRAVEEALPE